MPAPVQPLVAPQQLQELLRTARKRCQLTQKDLAARLGMSQSHLSYLESHPAELSVDQLLAWAAAVGLTIAVGNRPEEAPAAAPATRSPGPAW
jgi:HTH-type transcriptional regulator/antitoxin HipB